jgi:formate hydrogenlyase subunit 6/NADH:ubiquinone oxidoreductase subunit I
VCNFDAIVMTHEHEMSTFSRNGDRVDLPKLLEIGHKFQKETAWIPPTKRAKVGKDEEPDAAKAGSEAESS